MRIFNLIFILLAILLMALSGCLKKSKYSNCAVAPSEKSFTGKWLASADPAIRQVKETADCKKQDQQLDQGDGPKLGRVRWAECYSGPDCGDAGVF